MSVYEYMYRIIENYLQGGNEAASRGGNTLLRARPF